MDESGLRSFVYSINFQIREIPATNHRFSCEKSLVLCGSRFLKKKKKKKKHNFYQFEISLPRESKQKLILPLKKYFKTLKDMIIGTAST